MKQKSNFLSKYMISKKYKIRTDKKDKKIFLKCDLSKNLKNFNISLILKREREKELHKANSTTQTGQKSIIFHTNNDNIINENSDNKASEKDYNNYFILNDKLYTKNNVYGKVYYQNNNSNDNKYDKNDKSVNQRKSYRLNNLTLIDICYNSVNNDYKNNYPKIKSSNIDNYHYYDSTQRHIEKIIPKINEYLNENSTEKNNSKKHRHTYATGYKPNKDRYNFMSSNILYDSFKNLKLKRSSRINTTDSKKLELCLYNSINSDSFKNSKKLFKNKKIENRGFSSEFPHKNVRKLWEFQKLNLNFRKPENKIRIGIFDYISTPKRTKN
jgi:hypothetical protein